jgi:fatty-acyl-CoA synthase
MRVLDAYEKRGHAFTGGYGMTETSPGLTALQPRYSRSKAGSAGLTHFFSAMRVVDGSGQDAGPGRPGEIIAAGPNVITEYWNRPDAKESAFTDGWFHSGDIGYLDDDGFLYISDRLKDMIISGGENIYSAEVEAVIMQLDAVKAAAVIGLPDAHWGEVPHAVLVLADGAALDAGVLYRHLTENLARYKVPKSYQIVDELPRTSSGKIQKRVLREALPGTEVIALPVPERARLDHRS